ncbi:hypothetical protein HYH03_011871 [Edaphochlamys debaryana]|uniref:Plastid lipid-associated protein/fibrillin conserved domain-containing protein n=1 Tax=Edaphochlamys debaryana TaxID=47281 RepID=A0A835XZ68_9CHLO|nr:hypothetical protein HYH03_011871 [Edaphochlamys debaryana]|eukprot:KAG2489590.1 hypothetical protein HYH03_011871 [Edaphochlamys debaryana]
MRGCLQASTTRGAANPRVAARHSATLCAARRSHVAFSSTNGFVASAVAVAEPARPAGPAELKKELLSTLEGLDRGIFGVPAAKKARILALISELEQHNTHAAPTADLSPVNGDWRLLYSTITITGAKKTKLGLREFVKLGAFIQNIDTANNLAVNRIDFSVTGLSAIKGDLAIRAQYAVESPTRVGITYLDSALKPAQLQKIFEATLPLLLSIFNPEGHLDISYLDPQPRELGAWRVGRDNKGNVFLLERSGPA